MGEAVGSDNSTLRQRVSHSTRTPSAEVQNTDDVSKSSRGHDGLIPPAKWTFNKDGFPQAIAHRGYKAEYPENTMGAFRGAIEVGAHAIETDLHLSKDDVVVISHVSSAACRTYEHKCILPETHTHTSHTCTFIYIYLSTYTAH